MAKRKRITYKYLDEMLKIKYQQNLIENIITICFAFAIMVLYMFGMFQTAVVLVPAFVLEYIGIYNGFKNAVELDRLGG